MSKRGRPVKGTDKIDTLSGSEDAKYRLKVIMKSVSGELSVAEACQELGMEKSPFYRLREQALSGALSSLEPKQSGRPRITKSAEQERIEELEEQLQDMRIDLEAAYIREELSVAMPHVLIPREERLRLEKERKEKAAAQKAAKKKKKQKQARQQRKANRKG